jgi:hypothetical protein
MDICIQDPATYRTFLIPEGAISRFSSDGTDEADIVFVMPSSSMVQEVGASRLTDTEDPSIQIVDTDGDRAWHLSYEDLNRFAVDTPPDGDDTAWFAMPSAKEVLAAVPVFRKALVQHGS